MYAQSDGRSPLKVDSCPEDENSVQFLFVLFCVVFEFHLCVFECTTHYSLQLPFSILSILQMKGYLTFDFQLFGNINLGQCISLKIFYSSTHI